MDMDNNEKSAMEHSRAQLLSYVKGTLENSFLTLASVLKDLSEFRPKNLLLIGDPELSISFPLMKILTIGRITFSLRLEQVIRTSLRRFTL